MIRGYFFIALSFLSIQAYSQAVPAQNAARDSNMVKQLFFAGLREKMSENYASASINFNKIVSLDTNNHAAYFELANANLRLDRLTEAEQNIKQAIKLNPDNPWYWRLLGELYKRNNKMPELIDVFNQLIQLQPQNDSYYFDKANAQFLADRPEDSKKTYDEIEAKFGQSKNLENARKRLQQYGKASDSDIVKLLEGNQAGVKNYLYAAGLLLQKGNDTEAFKVLVKAQQIEPTNYEVNLALADIYRKQKNDDAAFTALKMAFESSEMPLDEKIKVIVVLFPKLNQAVVSNYVTDLCKTLAEQNPTEEKALILYGDVLCRQNKLGNALLQYQAALKLNEQVYVVWEKVINIQTLLGHYADAIKVGDEALSLYPNQAGLYYYMAYALFKTGRYEAAQNHLKNVLQLDVENKRLQAQVYVLQSDIYINQNNFAQAKTAFDKAIAAEPDNYLVMNNYAYYLALRNDDLEKAAKLAETAANALPNNPSVIDTYAFILFKQGKYDQAKTWIEKALQNNNNMNGVYLERYGDILYMKGEKDAALIQWKNAKEAGNGSEVLNKKINEKKYFK